MSRRTLRNFPKLAPVMCECLEKSVFDNNDARVAIIGMLKDRSCLPGQDIIHHNAKTTQPSLKIATKIQGPGPQWSSGSIVHNRQKSGGSNTICFVVLCASGLQL